MKEIRPSSGTGWIWLVGIVVAVGVFCGVAAIVPGPRCVDGTSSDAIGRRGACSYHRGVTSGQAFLGVPAGLFAGIGTIALLEAMLARAAARREKEVGQLWDQARASSAPVKVAAPRQAGEELEGYLRRAMLAGGLIAFLHKEEDGTGWRERTVRPRWLQMSEVAGESTYCLVGDCTVDGRRAFALSRIDQVRSVSPAPAG